MHGEICNEEEKTYKNFSNSHIYIPVSESFNNVVDRAKKASEIALPVHLEGETGVGKEILAYYIHSISSRAAYPFVPINCGAIPDALFEAEVFGFERGAFTNAIQTHKGYFEQAHGGTIFLDEISEIPSWQQVKLLRILENKYIIRIGGEKKIPIDVKVITAANRSLWSLVQQSKFRSDLYYRLFVFGIYIPPLRYRKEDVLSFIKYFISKYGGHGINLDKNAIDKLLTYSWPGNVRELESCIARAIINASNKSSITYNDIELNTIDDRRVDYSERAKLENALTQSNGVIKSTAMLLGVHRNTIYNKISKLKVDLNKFRVK